MNDCILVLETFDEEKMLLKISNILFEFRQGMPVSESVQEGLPYRFVRPPAVAETEVVGKLLFDIENLQFD